MSEQAVMVQFTSHGDDFDELFELEDRVQEAVEDASAGVYDGSEFDSDGTAGKLFLYGPDADRILSLILPILKQSELMKGATVVLRYGAAEANCPERITEI